MEKRIAVLRGDGIGPEVVNESIKVLERVAQKFGHTFHYYDIIGGVAGAFRRQHPVRLGG